MIDFSMGGDEAEEPVEFLSFDPMDNTERPPAPPEDDYPQGCDVELIDATTAKEAQTDQYWEPIMDVLFIPKRYVKVIRHSGDYAYVECTLEGEQHPVDEGGVASHCDGAATMQGGIKIGCSLYRACLKEPKVKFKRYNPYALSTKELGETPGDDKEIIGSDADELGEAIAPEKMMLLAPQPPTAPGDDAPPFMRGNPTPGVLSPSQQPGILSPNQPFSHALNAPPNASQQPGATNMPQQGNAISTNVPLPKPSRDVAKRYRDDGNRAFRDRRFQAAVNAYTLAFQADKNDVARLLSNRSAAYLALEMTEHALADARAVIRASPRNVSGYMRAGNALRALRRYEEARNFYNKALALEPQNMEVTYAIMGNGAAAVFRRKTEHLPLEIVLHHEKLCLLAMSRRKFSSGDIVFSETAHVTVPYLPKNAATPGSFCGECNRSLIRKSTIESNLKHIPEGGQLVNSLFPEAGFVPCSEGCATHYCSENCRNIAWTNHHWVLCEKKGKWNEGSAACTAILEASRDKFSRELLASVALAVRMIVAMCSSGKSLGEAVSMFVWLSESKLRPDEELVAQEVLRKMHVSLQQQFGREENALLDWSLFYKTFRQARHSAITRRCSPWNSFIERVESHLALLTQKSESTTHEPDTSSTVMQGLSAVLRSEGVSIPSLETDVMMIFDVFSVCCSNDNAVEQNIAMKSIIETTHNVPIVSLSSIKRGSPLVSRFGSSSLQSTTPL